MSEFEELVEILDRAKVRFSTSGRRSMAVHGPDGRVVAVISETDRDYTTDPLSIEATGDVDAMAAFISEAVRF